MRSLASYVLVALVIGMALDFIAPAASVVDASNGWPSLDAVTPIVNRANKTDRLDWGGNTLSGKSRLEKTVHDVAPAMPASRPVLEGCDPAFSPLSASAQLNYPSHCVVDNSDGRSKSA
jgi:hypothetical protein